MTSMTMTWKSGDDRAFRRLVNAGGPLRGEDAPRGRSKEPPRPCGLEVGAHRERGGLAEGAGPRCARQPRVATRGGIQAGTFDCLRMSRDRRRGNALGRCRPRTSRTHRPWSAAAGPLLALAATLAVMAMLLGVEGGGRRNRRCTCHTLAPEDAHEHDPWRKPARACTAPGFSDVTVHDDRLSRRAEWDAHRGDQRPYSGEAMGAGQGRGPTDFV